MQAVLSLFHLLPMIRMNFWGLLLFLRVLSRPLVEHVFVTLARRREERRRCYLCFIQMCDIYIYSIFMCVYIGRRKERERDRERDARLAVEEQLIRKENANWRSHKTDKKRNGEKRKARYKIFLKREHNNSTFLRSRGCCGSLSWKWTCAGSPSCHTLSLFTLSSACSGDERATNQSNKNPTLSQSTLWLLAKSNKLS